MNNGKKIDTLNLPLNESAIIEQIVLNSSGFSIPFIITTAKRYIKNINETHIFYIGFLVGQIQATEKTLEKIYNNLQPCQRQN